MTNENIFYAKCILIVILILIIIFLSSENFISTDDAVEQAKRAVGDEKKISASIQAVYNDVDKQCTEDNKIINPPKPKKGKKEKKGKKTPITTPMPITIDGIPITCIRKNSLTVNFSNEKANKNLKNNILASRQFVANNNPELKTINGVGTS